MCQSPFFGALIILSDEAYYGVLSILAEQYGQIIKYSLCFTKDLKIFNGIAYPLSITF